MLAGDCGSNAIAETERLGRKSELARHESPALSLTQMPPEAVPAKRRLGLDGSKASARTRPPTLDGPSESHWLGCSPADLGRAARAVACSMAARCELARKSCSADGGPFSSASSSRWYCAFIAARS